MREIKFRAWDGQMMWYPETKTVDNNNTHFVFFNREKSIGWGLYQDKLMNRLVSGEFHQLMQFTGLKDKNGHEIYEGDIIKWGHLPDSKEVEVRIATVRIDPDIQFDCRNISFPHVFHYGSFAYGGKQLEVIGNIYENPELLIKNKTHEKRPSPKL